LIGSDKPISFNADLWKGQFDIPEQKITFREAMLSESKNEIPLHIRLAGRISSVVPHLNADIETQAGLTRFEQAMGFGRIVVNDAHVSGRLNWDDQGSAASASFGVGSVGVGLSPGPEAVCIDEISTLNVSASGTISRVPESAALPSMTQAPQPCVSLPRIPDFVEFQISGNYPVGPQDSLVRVERQDGTGIRIPGVRSEILKLQIQDGRLASINTRTNIEGIGNLQGAGGIGILANLRQSKDSLQMDSELSAADGTQLLQAAITNTPTRLTLDATQLVVADRVLGRDKTISVGSACRPRQCEPARQAQQTAWRCQLRRWRTAECGRGSKAGSGLLSHLSMLQDFERMFRRLPRDPIHC
jgi:hypothetical protein